MSQHVYRICFGMQNIGYSPKVIMMAFTSISGDARASSLPHINTDSTYHLSQTYIATISSTPGSVSTRYPI